MMDISDSTEEERAVLPARVEDDSCGSSNQTGPATATPTSMSLGDLLAYSFLYSWVGFVFEWVLATLTLGVQVWVLVDVPPEEVPGYETLTPYRLTAVNYFWYLVLVSLVVDAGKFACSIAFVQLQWVFVYRHRPMQEFFNSPVARFSREFVVPVYQKVQKALWLAMFVGGCVFVRSGWRLLQPKLRGWVLFCLLSPVWAIGLMCFLVACMMLFRRPIIRFLDRFQPTSNRAPDGLTDQEALDKAAPAFTVGPDRRYSKFHPGDERIAESCPVCLQDIETDEIVREIVVCQHWFHDECLAQWLKLHHASCPTCRRRVGETTESV
jgi:hypothetical protein